MSRSFGQQVGRSEVSFSPLLDGGLRPKRVVDKIYDVKVNKKQPNISLADRSTRTPEKKSHDMTPSFMSYHISHTQVETHSPAHSFQRVPRGLGTDHDSETQKQQAVEKKRQYKAMQDELKSTVEEHEKRKAKRIPPFAVMLGHDSSVIGSANVGPESKAALPSSRNPKTHHIPGGKFPKAERLSEFSQCDGRDYSPNWEKAFPHTSSVNMQRQASRDHGQSLGVSITPESNRIELQQLIRKVEHELATESPSGDSPSPSPCKSLDFFLSGGRADVPVHGLPPPAYLLVEDTVNEISGHTSRLQIQLFNLERGEKIEQQRKAKWHAKAMTQQQLQKYRQTNEYKLTKQYRIFQDQELVKLTEDLKTKDATKLNIGGSSYRLNLLAHQLEGKRQATRDALESLIQDDIDDCE